MPVVENVKLMGGSDGTLEQGTLYWPLGLSLAPILWHTKQGVSNTAGGNIIAPYSLFNVSACSVGTIISDVPVSIAALEPLGTIVCATLEQSIASF
jgi:hypothetical protein